MSVGSSIEVPMFKKACLQTDRKPDYSNSAPPRCTPAGNNNYVQYRLCTEVKVFTTSFPFCSGKDIKI